MFFADYYILNQVTESLGGFHSCQKTLLEKTGLYQLLPQEWNEKTNASNI
jgi:hypothetical protein